MAWPGPFFETRVTLGDDGHQASVKVSCLGPGSGLGLCLEGLGLGIGLGLVGPGLVNIPDIISLQKAEITGELLTGLFSLSTDEVHTASYPRRKANRVKTYQW